MREQDGLAMSSRNSYLTSEERKKAPALWRALCAGRKAFEEGERNATEIRKKVDISANKNGVKLAYISVCERWNMREMQLIDNQETLLCAATIIGRTRLIDNLLLIGH